MYALRIVLGEYDWLHFSCLLEIVNNVARHRRILSLPCVVSLCIPSTASYIGASDYYVNLPDRLFSTGIA